MEETLVLWHAFLLIQFAGAAELGAGIAVFPTFKIADRLGVGSGSWSKIHKCSFLLLAALILAAGGFAICKTTDEFLLMWESGLALGALCGLWLGYLEA